MVQKKTYKDALNWYIMPIIKVDQTFQTFVKKPDGSIKYETIDPTYVIAGDTDSVYLELNDIVGEYTDPENIIEFADGIGQAVNSSFDEFLSTVFNIPVERRSIVSTDREAVSDKSVFFGKKKYVMHVINMEGKTVDKQKKMGVEIIKSDTPIVIQKFLQDIVDMMLAHTPYQTIKEYVFDFKKRFYEMSMLEIGAPKNIKVLNKYYDIYEQRITSIKTVDSGFGTPKLATDPFKGIAYHAKASMIYNMMCGVNDVMIRAGDKIKITYVIGEEFNAIAIPANIEPENIPEFMNTMDINYDRMWQNVEKKLEIYLKPIGYDIDTRKAEHSQIFFPTR